MLVCWRLDFACPCLGFLFCPAFVFCEEVALDFEGGFVFGFADDGLDAVFFVELDGF